MGVEFFAFSGLINGLVAFGLGIFIILRNWRSRVNQLYFLLVIAVTIWSLSYWQWLSSEDNVSALFWVRMFSIGSTLIPVFYFHWVICFLNLNKKEKRAIILVYFIAILFLLFSFSELFVKGVREKLFFPFWPDPGILYHFYLFFTYILLVIYSIYLLFKKYKISLKEKKAQILYIIIGSIIALGGGVTNFFLWYNIPIPPYGNFLIASYPFLFAYAIIRHHLFDIRVIATEILTFSIWIFLFIRAAFSWIEKKYQDFVINGFVLMAIVIVGILLIRSVWRVVRQQEKLEKMTVRIKKAYDVEKKARAELQKLDEAKGQFMMATQHHLRTPLTSMAGYMDLIFSGTYGKVSPKLKETLKKFHVSTNRLIKIVNELLDLSQFQLGKKVVSLEPGIDISSVLEEVVEELKLTAETKDIYLKLKKSKGSIPRVSLDVQKFKAALSNIIDNGIKYTNKGGVTVSYGFSGNVVRIMIKDTGIGMTQEDLNRVFKNTFERGKEAKKVFTAGRGIGLYIAYQIIKAHNGKVWVESQGKRKGSTFYIELPCSKTSRKNPGAKAKMSTGRSKFTTEQASRQ